MKFKVYLSVFLTVLLLSAISGYFRDTTTNSVDPFILESQFKPRFQQAAVQLAERLLVENVTEWQVHACKAEYDFQEDTIFVDGKNSRGEQVFIVVFDKTTCDPLSIMCCSQEDTPLKEISAKKPRDMATFWLGRLENKVTNPYIWIHDGKPGRDWYCSYWRSPTRCLSIVVNPRTGQLLRIRFYAIEE